MLNIKRRNKFSSLFFIMEPETLETIAKTCRNREIRLVNFQQTVEVDADKGVVRKMK